MARPDPPPRPLSDVLNDAELDHRFRLFTAVWRPRVIDRPKERPWPTILLVGAVLAVLTAAAWMSIDRLIGGAS